MKQAKEDFCARREKVLAAAIVKSADREQQLKAHLSTAAQWYSVHHVKSEENYADVARAALQGQKARPFALLELQSVCFRPRPSCFVRWCVLPRRLFVFNPL